MGGGITSENTTWEGYRNMGCCNMGESVFEERQIQGLMTRQATSTKNPLLYAGPCSIKCITGAGEGLAYNISGCVVTWPN